MADVSALIGDLAAPYALFTSAQRYIGTLVMDVTVREVHSDEDTITMHPVEGGTPISDHVFANPQVVEIVCGASDSTAGYDGYAQQVYEQFLALKAERQPFDIGTGKRSYQDMLFGNITVVTDETSEYALMVTVRCQQVIRSQTSSYGGSGGQDAGYSDDASTQASPQDTAPEGQSGQQQTSDASSVTFQPEASTVGPGPGGGAGTAVGQGVDATAGFTGRVGSAVGGSVPNGTIG